MPPDEPAADSPPRVVVVGSFVQDLAFATATFPAPGETRIGTFRTGAGGKGFNQAVACRRQEIPTLFIGAAGDDFFARAVADFARQEGLQTAFEIQPDHSTGAAGIVVNATAENLIVVALGANEHLSAAHIRRHERQIAEAAILVSQLECSLEAVSVALGIARAHGLITILNPAPINQALSRDLLRLADIITPNETEFSFLLQKLFGIELSNNYWQQSDAELHALCRQCEVPTVVLTLGSQGCFVSQLETRNSKPETSSASAQPFYRVPALSLSPVDTTGAGDAFTGGLAAGMLYYPHDFRQAVAYATVVAGLSTLNQGTSPAMPRRPEVVRQFSAK